MIEDIDNLVDEAFKADGLLAQHFRGYMPREQQIELSHEIRKSIAEHKLLFAEAPTGVGKSLANLVPLAEVLFQTNAPVIVVTSGIVLQEQYFHKDIPTLERVLGRKLNATMIKGRNNYLCIYKANQFKIEGTTNTNDNQEYAALVDWSGKTKTGDSSELKFVPKPWVWADFAAVGDHECHGKSCVAYDACHYYRERRKVMTAKLVVCNYHYFLNAILTDGMLPAGVKVVVMDEGHEISAIARDFQEQKYTMNALRSLFDSFLKTGRRIEKIDPDIGAEFHGIIEEAEFNALQGSIESMFRELAFYFRSHKGKDQDNLTLNQDQRHGLQEMAQPHLDALNFTLRYIDRYLEVHGLDQEERWLWKDQYPDHVVAWQLAQEKLYEGLKGKARLVERFFGLSNGSDSNLFLGDEEDGNETAVVLPKEDVTIIHWMAEEKDGNVSLHIKPAMAAPLMSEILDTERHPYTPIILSATLAVNGNFKHLMHDLGVRQEPNALVVTSPFDLDENVLWYLPKEMPAGNTREHQAVAEEEMLKIVHLLEGRTLCLFTSVKALQHAVELFRRKLPKNIRVIAQNEYPRQRLIEMMKANPHTVLMGTRSLFTGIDIQGQNLSAVLMDKLPYPMIGDPVNDYLMNQPRGFWTFTLPEMIVSLKQGFGRLNRTMNDKGVVAVFDGRLSTARYKPIIFNSFDFKVKAAREFEDVRAYVNSIQF